MTDGLTMTIDEAAKKLGVSRGSAYAAAKKGELPTIKAGHRILVPIAAFNKMMDGQAASTEEKGPATPKRLPSENLIKIAVELSLKPELLGAFLARWPDYRDSLSEHAEILGAAAWIPPSGEEVITINLPRFE